MYKLKLAPDAKYLTVELFDRYTIIWREKLKMAPDAKYLAAELFDRYTI